MATIGILHVVFSFCCSATSAPWYIHSFCVGDNVEVDFVAVIDGRREFFRLGVESGRGGAAVYLVRGIFGIPPKEATTDLDRRYPVLRYAQDHQASYPKRPYVSKPSAWNKMGFYYESVHFRHAGTLDSVVAITFPISPQGVWLTTLLL